ncbi:MAG: glycerate kinase [Acidiferrobacterales bacterium]|nr:glycerate kinase [Acidiferrobacterales bacterium]
MIENPRKFLTDLFSRAVQVSSARHCLPPYIKALQDRRIHAIGAGKAAGAMARALEDSFSGDLTGTVVTRYGHGVELDRIQVIEAAHPLPDERGMTAAQTIVDSLTQADSSVLVVCLISGGASALLALPHDGLSLHDKKNITNSLLMRGADIHEINTVRKHLSAVKGGQLMKRIYPARSLTFCISDVVGDDPSTIGSGPTMPDPTTCDDVLRILSKFDVAVPATLTERLKRGELETPKPDDPIFRHAETQVIARPQSGLEASTGLATASNCRAVIIGDSITGDTNIAAQYHADLVRKKLTEDSEHRPFVLLSGGETTVTVTGKGRGGPNTQFALALAVELQGEASVYAIACDTDGIDGTETNAGALIDPTTLSRAERTGLDPRKFLTENDSYGFFSQLGDLVETGPTLTNINDFRAILVNKIPD